MHQKKFNSAKVSGWFMTMRVGNGGTEPVVTLIRGVSMSIASLSGLERDDVR